MSYHHQKETHETSTTYECHTIYAKGYDAFLTRPNTVEEVRCKVCGRACLVKRNQFGPTGAIAAVIGSKSLYDYFYCPEAGKEWHSQSLKLVQERENTSSQGIKKLITQDLDRALKQGEAS